MKASNILRTFLTYSVQEHTLGTHSYKKTVQVSESDSEDSISD